MTSRKPELDIGQWYGKQSEALEAMKERGDTIMMKHGCYLFASITDQESFMDFILETPKENRCFFELLLEGKPQRMFCDIDGENLTITREQLYEQWTNLMKEVFEEIHVPFKSRNVKLLDASKGSKLSGHWSYVGGLVFKDCDQQKEFWNYVESIIEVKYPDLCYVKERKDKKLELKTVLDLGVYSRNRAMRTIYSHKEGSDRVLKPCKMSHGKLKNLEHINPLDYLIYVPPEPSDQFYQFAVPEHKKVRRRFFTKEQIEALILEHVAHVEVVELSGRMFKLKTSETRNCLINGEENESDNCYVVWRRDGLYFGCHDVGCEGQQKLLCSFEAVVDPKFLEGKLEFYADFRELVGKEINIGTVQYWCDNTIVLVENSGNQFFLTKNKRIDPLTKEESIYYRQVSTKNIYTNLKVNCFGRNPDFDKKIYDKYKDQPKKCPDGLRKHMTKHTFTLLGPSITTRTGFLDQAVSNRCLPSFNHVEFFPYMDRGEKIKLHDSFNVFTGFPLEKVPLRSGISATFEQSLLYKHIGDELMNGDVGEFNHFLDHIADMVQQPAYVRGPSHLFYTAPGMGKGMMAVWMSRLLGSDHVITFNNVADYFNNFNSEQANKILKIFEEVSDKGEAFHKHDRLKADQTKTRDRIEPKGVDPYYIRHCARYWYYTNNENALYIENNDRRHTMHKANNRYADKTEYFDQLWPLIRDEQFCRMSFEFFATREYTEKSVLTAYETKYKTQQKISNLPNGLKFLVHLIENNFSGLRRDGDKVSVKELKASYKEWCEENGTRYHANTMKTQIQKLGIEESKQARFFRRKTEVYKLNVGTIREQFRVFLKQPAFDFDIADLDVEDSDSDSDSEDH